jgi:UDP-GlcNAc3NAcA epimerase
MSSSRADRQTRLLTVVGARPQFIKAAPLSAAIARNPTLDEVLVHTGQHYDPAMSEVFFAELEIPTPGYNLGVQANTHGAMTGRMLEGLERVMLQERPDAVVVYGDTNSTLAGALSATKLHIPLVHIEAGLRSFNRRMPEEINRVATDAISDLLLCPSAAAAEQLRREASVGRVEVVGDIMHDAVLRVRTAALRQPDLARSLGIGGDYAVCTVHRAENVDDPLRFRSVLDFVGSYAEDHQLPVVLPVHPRAKQALAGQNIGSRLHLVDSLGYLDMQALVARSSLVLTDSGGLQKEAYFHRVPCVTLRDETEWTETIAAGWNRLWTTPGYETPRSDIPEYGAGDAADKCLEAIKALLS